MSDKFTKAFIAGLGASIIMNLFNFISFYVLQFSSVRYLDYASIALYGSKPESFLAAAFAQLAQILFSGFLGMVMLYYLSVVGQDNVLLKGWIFSFKAWFVIFGIGLLFKLPLLEKVPTNTAISNFTSASIYGITAAWLLTWLEQK